MSKKAKIYDDIIEKVFFDRWSAGTERFGFTREDLPEAAEALGHERPKNLGDILYSFRFRKPFPARILDTQPDGLEWVIAQAGKANYEFKLVKINRILPNPNALAIDIPDATPEIIRTYALDDEQALLAIVRYNRLIDTFLGLTTYSLQNHLRTTVKLEQGSSQIEIDELYIGLDKHGCHFVIPVQAKGGNDQIGLVQVEQDIEYAAQKFPGMRCRAIAAQFLTNQTVVLFELTIFGDEIKVVEEKHYRLVDAHAIDPERVRNYRN